MILPLITSWKVLDAWRNYDYFGLIIHGPLRCGKSSLAIQIVAEVCGIIQNPDWKKMMNVDLETWSKWVREETKPDWNAWKSWMKFLPEDFFGLVDIAQKEQRQLPCAVWDDAGMWASQYRWAEEFAKRISDYINAAATDFASIIFTTPDPRWLLKHIRDLPGGHSARVCKTTGNQYQSTLRYVRVYEGWLAPDMKKSGVKPIYEERFDILLPADTFLEYDKVRRSYAALAKQRILDLLKDVANKKGEEAAESLKTRIERELGVPLSE